MTPVIVHSSDIKSWIRCPEAWHLDHLGYPRKQLSATAYGSVMHAAIHVLERTGDLDKAVDTFKHYWSPANIEAICEPVDIWIRRDSYGSLASRGVETLRRFHDLLQYDDSELLALEYEFVVPMHGTRDRLTGEPHYLGGTLDRLALRRYKGQLTVCTDDYKSGIQPNYLRHDVQGTAYCYATTQREFWVGNPEYHTDGFEPERAADLLTRTRDAARKFWWINLNTFKWVDAGFRGPRDYERLRLAVQGVADSIQAEIFPLSLTGEHCQWCPHRDVCGGIGLDDEEGAIA